MWFLTKWTITCSSKFVAKHSYFSTHLTKTSRGLTQQTLLWRNFLFLIWWYFEWNFFPVFFLLKALKSFFLYFFVRGRFEFVWHVNVRRKKLRDSSKKIGIKRNDETTGFLNFLKAKNFFRHSCLNEYGQGERIRLIFFFWQERQIAVRLKTSEFKLYLKGINKI